ncbi:MAG TPA: PCRF domain-containing protein [Chloroflexia bacterium]|nr:PCRF domain-containing protein [Chloroflexia bacterium]
MSVARTAVGAFEPKYYADVLIEIRSGSGGEGAELFVEDLMEMYRNFSQSQGWSTQIVMQQEANGEHPRLVLLKVVGEGAYPVLKYETGVHRVQRARDSERQGVIKTSTASVVIMPIPGERLRSEKIRTYNVPDDEARDHRYRVNVRGVRRILNGELDLVLRELPGHS